MSSSDPVQIGLIFSDNAIIERGTNKLSIIGCFSHFNASAFPFRAPPFYVSLFLTNMSSREGGRAAFAINIEEPNTGMTFASAGGHFTGKQGLNAEEVYEMSVPFGGVTFPQAGKYFVKALVDAEIVGRRPLLVRSVSESQGS